MGNLKSCCCKDNDKSDDDREERSRILDDVCDGQQNLCDDIYSSSTSAVSHQDLPSYGSIVNGSKAEQTALERILQKMASNVIDVAPGESMLIQQGEIVDRQKAYQMRLNQIKTPLVLKSTLVSRSGFNNTYEASQGNDGTQQLQATLNKNLDTRGVNYEPISGDEVQLINQISRQTAVAVQNGLKIDSNEEIVAQFNP